MQAIQHHRFGGPDVLEVADLPDLAPAPGQVRIAVEAAGVHLVDTTIRSGEAQGPMVPERLPAVPGREVAGAVDLVGTDVDPAWAGRRVVTHLGVTGGGYAEQVLVHAERLHALPDGLALETAVAAIGTGRTATGILDLAPVTANDVVVVTAASGGLGSTLLQAAVSAGATVVGLAGGPGKVAVVRTLGPTAVVDYRRPGWEDEVTLALGGRQPTLVYDGVGGETSHHLHRTLAPGGVLAQYTGADPADYPDYPDDREVRPVLGPALTSRPGGLRSLEEESLALAADGTRVPMVGPTYRLRDAETAHRDLEERRTVGKVVLVTDRDRP